jgi:hypothetical protein
VLIAIGLLAHAPPPVAAALLLREMLSGYFLGNRMHDARSRASVMKRIAGLLVTIGALPVVRGLSSARAD